MAFLCFIRSWILYEKANFEGHSLALEEGELELSSIWGTEEMLDEEAESDKPVVIGSIRHVVQVGYRNVDFTQHMEMSVRDNFKGIFL
jgi:hypothetical protein